MEEAVVVHDIWSLPQAHAMVQEMWDNRGVVVRLRRLRHGFQIIQLFHLLEYMVRRMEWEVVDWAGVTALYGEMEDAQHRAGRLIGLRRLIEFPSAGVTPEQVERLLGRQIRAPVPPPGVAPTLGQAREIRRAARRIARDASFGVAQALAFSRLVTALISDIDHLLHGGVRWAQDS